MALRGRRLFDAGAAIERLVRPELALRALLVSLVVCLGILAGRLALSLATPATLGWQARPLVVGTLPPGRMPDSASTLTGFDPFHRSEIPAGEAEPAPETTLDLKLTGVRALAGGDGTGSAIIRTPDHAQRAYRPGEEVLDGVRLAQVRPGSVVLMRGGSREILYLDERARRDDSTREALAAVAASSLPDLKDIRLAPRLRDGRMTGLRIVSAGTATFLKRNGLISGDVLLAVNGIEITSPARVEAAIGALESAGTVDVVIERDGQERTLTLALDG